MESNRWLSSIRKKREIKRTERLRKKYDFLIKEVYASQNKIVEQVVRQETSLCEQISLLQKEQQTYIQQIKEQFAAIIKKLESIELSNNSTQAKNIELLGDYSKKTISEISETESRTKEKIAGIQEGLEARNKEMQQLMVSISDKIEMVQNNATEKCSTLVEDKTNSIILSIDEVKELMKIVAVNSLLDEI